ncbi:hypothetical protein OIV83_000714 [Microbotryomycetes sp. JL201]|nr:hypothetical protein OIV83_000714 [Microbotryomycetes sp. JL201]
MSNVDSVAEPSTLSTVDGMTSSCRSPPRNFASQARQQARDSKGAMHKSPFILKRRLSHAGTGKDRDLTDYSLEDLSDMLRRNAVLLESSETLARLPGGESKLRAQRAKISSRIQELHDLQQLRSKLDDTHLETSSSADVEHVKTEADEPMSGIKEEANDADIASAQINHQQSPNVKQRIAARIQVPSPNSKTGAMSLRESIALQTAALERERAEAEQRQAQMELDAKRPLAVGEQLKGALQNLQQGALMSGYLFQGEDDESEIDPDDIDHLIANLGSSVRDLAMNGDDAGREGDPGELDPEEEATLNPYRTAYEAGWRQAVAEEDAGPAREIHP